MTGSGVGVISGLKQFSPSLKHHGKGGVVQRGHSFTAERCTMLTLLNLAAVLTLQTPPAPPPPPRMHTETRVMVMGDGPGGLDKDGDGQVSREEFAAPMTDAFGRMDTDGNDRLSPEELSAGHGPGGPGGEHEMMIFRGGPEGGPDGGPMRHRMEMHRTVPDGAPGERHEERIMVITDGAPGGPDGEREVVVRRMGPGGGPMSWHDGDGDTRIEIHRLGEGEGGNDLDTDGDGRISEAEFLAPMRAAFARMDTDHSGAIDTTETGGAQQVRVVTRTTERSSDQ